MIYLPGDIFVALLVAVFGIRMIYDGLRGERPELFHRLGLPAWLLALAGVVCLIPGALVGYVIYLGRSS